MKIALRNIHPNPYRDLSRNPISKDQVNSVRASIDRTGFWDNVVVRKHPTTKGVYQLAYGHNRLAALGCPNIPYDGDTLSAINEADFIVKDLSDYDMMTAMIDENATQKNINPKIIFENVTAALVLAEKMITECKNVTEFNKRAKNSRCPTQDNGQKTHIWRAEEFTKAKKCLEDGSGIGRGFLEKFLPDSSRMSHDVLQAAVDSHYAESRAAALEAEEEALEAEAAALEAEAAEAEAEAEAETGRERDKERAATKATKKRTQATQKKTKANQKKAEKAQVQSKGIDRDLLEQLPTQSHMAQVADLVKRHSIPKAKHADLIAACIKEDWSTNTLSSNPRTVKNMGGVWWFNVSGQAQKMRDQGEREQVKWKYRSKTLDEYAAELVASLRKVKKGVDAVTPFAYQIDNKHLKGKLVEIANELAESLDAISEATVSEQEKTVEPVKSLPAL